MTKELWTAILDAVTAILAIWVGYLVGGEMAKMILATWGALQVVIVAAIASGAYKEKAKLEADSRDLLTLSEVSLEERQGIIASAGTLAQARGAAARRR